MNKNHSVHTPHVNTNDSETLPDYTITTNVMGDNPTEANAELKAQADETMKKQIDEFNKEIEKKLKDNVERYNNALNNTLDEIMNGVKHKKEGSK